MKLVPAVAVLATVCDLLVQPTERFTNLFTLFPQDSTPQVLCLADASVEQGFALGLAPVSPNYNLTIE